MYFKRLIEQRLRELRREEKQNEIRKEDAEYEPKCADENLSRAREEVKELEARLQAENRTYISGEKSE